MNKISESSEPQVQRPRRLSRRDFLRLAGAAAAGLALARCTPSASPAAQLMETATATSVPSTATATTAASATPPPTSTAVPTSPPTATGVIPATATPSPAAVATAVPTAQPQAGGARSKVAIASIRDYDRARVRAAVQEMVDSLGGLGDVVRPGDRVAIKVNLTGGVGNKGPDGLSPMESFVTHPEVVRALGELVLDAGAGALFIVEAVYQWASYTEWGYEEVARHLGATLIDLNGTDPYPDYVHVAVPGGGEIYNEFIFNPILQEIDVFMSVAKMKCHWVAGVTHSLKNLIGLVPARFYRLTPEHSHRSAFHGPTDETAGQRVPRIIVELNKARPIHFALIDGIKTTEGGEGPWIRTFGPIAPGVLFAGKDPVATDAVATAAQGFDPTAPPMAVPFVRGLNHLALAAAVGLGTHRLEEIEVMGPSIGDVRRDFRPCVG